MSTDLELMTQYTGGLVIEPATRLSTDGGGEHTESAEIIANKIARYGFTNMLEKRQINVTADDNMNLKVSEPIKGIAVSAFEPTAQVVQKIQKYGYENMLKAGHIFEIS